VLDANAVLALLQNERGSIAVDRLIRRARRAQCRLMISPVSLGEVFYTVYASRGRPDAMRVIAAVEQLPIEMSVVRRRMAIQAAEVKATRGLGYADSYVAALAMSEGGRVVTGDPDFQRAEDLVRIKWIR
jgi:predicted nucleic acid-binding protein